LNRLSRAHERYRRQTDRRQTTDRQTDRQTDGRAIAYSEREREFTFAKNVDCVRDLGVLIDSNLIFSVNIAKVVSKAHARAYLIHKCFLSTDPATLVCAFVT